MTAAQQLIDEGRQEGRQEGRLEGRQEGRQEGFNQRGQEDVIDALEIRFEIVPEGLKEAIRSILDDTRLRILLKTAITCQSIEDFAKVL